MGADLCEISYHGQQIEIGGSADLKIRDCATGAWHLQTISFDASVPMSVLGCDVAVMPADQLIAYKRILGRDVDLQDIRDLAGLRP